MITSIPEGVFFLGISLCSLLFFAMKPDREEFLVNLEKYLFKYITARDRIVPITKEGKRKEYDKLHSMIYEIFGEIGFKYHNVTELKASSQKAYVDSICKKLLALDPRVIESLSFVFRRHNLLVFLLSTEGLMTPKAREYLSDRKNKLSHAVVDCLNHDNANRQIDILIDVENSKLESIERKSGVFI